MFIETNAQAYKTLWVDPIGFCMRIVLYGVRMISLPT